MKSTSRLYSPAAFLAAALFIVPAANADSRDATTPQSQIPDPPENVYRGNTEAPATNIRGQITPASNPPLPGAVKPEDKKKVSAPRLKPKTGGEKVGSPVEAQLGSGGIGGNLPIPDDLQGGIRIPGTEGAKLTIGSPNDQHETEADRVAGQVMDPDPPKGKSASGFSPGDKAGINPEDDPAGPVSGKTTPGSEVGVDPEDDPAGPVSGLTAPGSKVGLDPEDDPAGPVSRGK
jgi:hypothetical protein